MCDRGRKSYALGFLILVAPISPVGRLDIHKMAGYRVLPSIYGSLAREYERMHTVLIQNGHPGCERMGH